MVQIRIAVTGNEMGEMINEFLCGRGEKEFAEALGESPDGMALSFLRHYLYWITCNACDPNDRVLEIGCGDDSRAAHWGPVLLSRKVRDYLAIDNWSLSGIRRKGPPFKFLEADIEKWEPEGEYDKIVCLYVIRYFKNPEAVVEKIYRHLKDGGSAYFSIGNRWGWTGDIQTSQEIAEKMGECLKIFGKVLIWGIDTGQPTALSKGRDGVFCIAYKGDDIAPD